MTLTSEDEASLLGGLTSWATEDLELLAKIGNVRERTKRTLPS